MWSADGPPHKEQEPHKERGEVEDGGSDGVRPGWAALVMLLLLAGLWVLEFLDQLSGNELDQLGIHAHEFDGLAGILSAPFLHAGWDHLISNSLPFLVLGFLVLLGSVFAAQMMSFSVTPPASCVDHATTQRLYEHRRSG